MKKMLKRLCTGFLALATVVTTLPTTPVHAESKQYWTESKERVGIVEKVMNDGSIGSTFNEGQDVYKRQCMSRKYELNKDGSCREHLRQVEHENLSAQLKSFGRNRPAIILQCGEILKQVMQAIKNGMVIYVFTYYLGIKRFYSLAMFAFTVALMAGVFFMKPLIRMFRDTGRAYQFCMAASAGCSILLFVMCRWYGPGVAGNSMQFGPLFAVFVLNGIFSGAYYSFSNVMIPATVDYGEWKNGKGQAGIISAINGFCITAVSYTHLIAAVGTVITIPVLIFAIMVQKHMVAGMTMGAVK